MQDLETSFEVVKSQLEEQVAQKLLSFMNDIDEFDELFNNL